MTLKELEAKIEDVKYEAVTGPFSAFYDQMKVIYDELMVKYGGDINKVRRDMPRVNYVVSDLPQHIKEAWKKILSKEIKAESVFFSADTLAKQLHSHPELISTDYADAFNGFKNCNEFYDRKREHIGLIIEGKRPCLLILKPARNHTEAFVVSLYSLDVPSLGKKRRGKRIY